MAKRFFDVADITRMKVVMAAGPVLKTVARPAPLRMYSHSSGMPMHFSHATRLDRDHRRGNGF
jgi:hypothetical protein